MQRTFARAEALPRFHREVALFGSSVMDRWMRPGDSGVGTGVDAYIARFPPAVQAKLAAMRRTVRRAAPKAVEGISYRIPTSKMGWPWCISPGSGITSASIPRPPASARSRRSWRPTRGRGSVQFPLDRPLPLALVAKITRFRLREARARA